MFNSNLYSRNKIEKNKKALLMAPQQKSKEIFSILKLGILQDFLKHWVFGFLLNTILVGSIFSDFISFLHGKRPHSSKTKTTPTACVKGVAQHLRGAKIWANQHSNIIDLIERGKCFQEANNPFMSCSNSKSIGEGKHLCYSNNTYIFTFPELKREFKKQILPFPKALFNM